MLAAAAVVAVIAVGAVAGPGLLSGSATPTTALGAPRLVEETAASGLTHTFGGGDSASIGGGMAVFDCDDDQRPDLFIAGDDRPATLFRNRSEPAVGLRFTASDEPATRLDRVTGAYPIDIDADGHVDLAVLRVGGIELLRGLGGCRFERATEELSLEDPGGWVTAFSATWEQPSGLPTLALGRYLTLLPSGESTYDCDRNDLFRPRADGTGYAAPLTLGPGYCALSMLFSDWDGSGRRDLRVSNDRQYYDFVHGQEQLWRMAAGEPPRLYTADDGWVQMQIWGMGIASHDLTGDGLPEVYLTSQGDNKLQTLATGPGQPMYRDIALKRGVVATRPVGGGDVLPSTAWHPAFEDVNNDGFVDLYVSKGNVSRQEGYATRDPSNLFIGQPDGTFIEVADEAGIVNYDRGRGSALVDLDLDGLLDLVEVKLNAPVRVWRNMGGGTGSDAQPMGRWLGVRLRQPGGNRDAIGAVIEVQAGDALLRREVVIGGGHISGQLGPVHFGLGPAGEVRVRVTWPDGEQGPWLTATADQIVIVERDAAEVSPVAGPGS
ncbi:MAG: hypothetical protein A2V85_04400 [Chloroflexi bacterium RBG_16_72_14]|nr:MAG: hypothetical protein A2V85_04400 [Chloroflexi bacterium RBG_16_72_14]